MLVASEAKYLLAPGICGNRLPRPRPGVTHDGARDRSVDRFWLCVIRDLSDGAMCRHTSPFTAKTGPGPTRADKERVRPRRLGGCRFWGVAYCDAGAIVSTRWQAPAGGVDKRLDKGTSV